MQQDLEPGDSLVLARMLFNSGANEINKGNGDLAAERFQQSLGLLETMPQSDDVLDASGTVKYNYGVLLYRSGLYDEAESMLSEAADIYKDLVESRDTLQNRSAYVQTLSILAACLTDAGKYDDADHYYDLAIRAAEVLAADQENLYYQHTLAELYNNRGLSRNIRGDYKTADTYYAKASEAYGKIFARTGSESDRANYAVSLLNTGENAFKARDYKRSEEFFSKGLNEYRQAVPALGTYDEAQYYAWKSYYELIHKRDFDSALASGAAAYALQPDNILVKMNYAYALLYSGLYEKSDAFLKEIASSGLGEADTIKLDIEAQKASGLTDGHQDVILGWLGS